MSASSRLAASVLVAGIASFFIPAVAQTKPTPDLSPDLAPSLSPVAFAEVGHGLAAATVWRNRIYLSHNLGQTSGWARFVSSADQSTLAGFDFQRFTLVSLLQESIYYEMRITGGAVAGDTLFLTVQTEPQPILDCLAAIAVPGSPCPPCPPPVWPDHGAYDIVAINQNDLRPVRRVVVTKEVITAPRVMAIC